MTGIERSVGRAMSEVKQEYFRMNTSGKTKTERTEKLSHQDLSISVGHLISLFNSFCPIDSYIECLWFQAGDQPAEKGMVDCVVLD